MIEIVLQAEGCDFFLRQLCCMADLYCLDLVLDADRKYAFRLVGWIGYVLLLALGASVKRMNEAVGNGFETEFS